MYSDLGDADVHQSLQMRLLRKRCMALCLRGSLTVLLIVAFSVRGGISQDGDLDEDVTGRNVTRIRLLSYFPCTTALSPDECDVFAYAAAELALEEVNGFISSDSFPGGALESVVFELLPVSEAVSECTTCMRHRLWMVVSIQTGMLAHPSGGGGGVGGWEGCGGLTLMIYFMMS